MHLVKVAVLGQENSGKTSLIHRLSHDRFVQIHRPTIGIDMVLVLDQFKGNWLKFQVWDTAGQERFTSVIPVVLKNTRLILFVVDLTSVSSLDLDSQWKTITDQRHTFVDDCIIVLVGNKADINTKGHALCTQFAKDKKIKYVEVSAKTSIDLRWKLLLDHAESLLRYQTSVQIIETNREKCIKLSCFC